jgi:hypothetical protein
LLDVLEEPLRDRRGLLEALVAAVRGFRPVHRRQCTDRPPRGGIAPLGA